MSRSSRLSILLVSLLAAAVFARLGVWQLDRLKERRAQNRAAAAARDLPVLDLNSSGDGSRVNRRVTVRGEYQHEDEVVLRGHVQRELPGVQVVTPLRIEGSDSVVLVNRGFLPSPDATFAVTDSLREPGPVTVNGIAFLVPVSADSGAPRTTSGKETWRRLDREELGRRLSYPLLDIYILQSPDSTLPRLPRRLEPLALDDGPHLSYAIQWFAFALIAVTGGFILASRKAAR